MVEHRNNDNDFNAHRLLIMHQMAKLEACLQEIDRKIDELVLKDMQQVWIEISSLKVKAGIWGGLSGLISILLAVGVAWLSNKFGGGKP